MEISKLSHSLKNRFVKDYKLPIQVVQEPVFSYALEQLEPFYSINEKVELLAEVVDELGEEGFFSESNRVKEALIEAIKSTTAYEALQNDKMTTFKIQTKAKQQDIYHMGNVNRTFISIDLVKANFNAFKFYNPELVLNYDTYEELISSVTKYDYFKKSKYLRQVIFGNLMPKKQQTIQKFLIGYIMNILTTTLGVKEEDFVTTSSDEIVFYVDPTNIDLFVDKVSKVIDNYDGLDLTGLVKVEAFTLKSIGDKKFFVKEMTDGSIEFKGIQSYFFLQVLKYFKGEEITDMDKKFYFEGMLATFDKSIFED